MRLSDLILEVRDIASVLTANRWADKDVARFLNAQQRSLVRKAVEVNQAFHNHTFQLAATVGRVKHSDIIAYRLPPWVMKVAAVRYGSTTPTAEAQQLVIPRADQSWAFGGGCWRWSANHELELVGFSVAQALELEVAKVPALMTKGTLPDPSIPGVIGANQMRLDSDASVDALNFPHESVADSYAGSLFEITGPASSRKGQILRCIASQHNQGTSNVQTILTMDANWTTVPATSDTYEMHAEIQTEHCRLLTLLAARALLAQERNVQGIAAYGPEIAEQWSLYIQHVSERDQAGPHQVVGRDDASPYLPSVYAMETF